MTRTAIGSFLLCAWVLWAGGAGQWAVVDETRSLVCCAGSAATTNVSL